MSAKQKTVAFARRFGTGIDAAIYSDGTTFCNCGRILEDEDCPHIHPMIVAYINSSHKDDRVLELLVGSRRVKGSKPSSRDVVSMIRTKSLPMGTVVRLTSAGGIAQTGYVRMLPDGRVAQVLKPPYCGIAMSSAEAGHLVDVTVQYQEAARVTFGESSYDVNDVRILNTLERLEQNAAGTDIKEISITATPAGVWRAWDMAEGGTLPEPPAPAEPPKPPVLRRKFRLE